MRLSTWLFSIPVVFALFAVSSSSAAAPPESPSDHPCLEKFASLRFRDGSRFDAALDQEDYHRLIQRKLNQIPDAEFDARMKEVIAVYQKLYPGFPREAFEAWLVSAKKPSDEGLTLGEVLQKEYKAFQRPEFRVEQRKKLQWGANRALEEVRGTLAQFNSRDPKAYARAVSALPRKIDDAFKGSCLGKNPVALRAVARDFGVMLASFGALQSKKESPTVENFPWEYVSSSLVFWGVLGEVGCRNMLSSGHQIGAEIPVLPEMSRAERLKKYIVERKDGLVAYFRWALLLNPIGMGVIAAGENLREKASPPEDYAVRLGYSISYDSLYGTVRRTFILDPLFLHFFPWMEPAIKPLVKSGVIAGIVRNGAEIGARVGIRTFDTNLFMSGDQFTKAYLAKMHEAGKSGSGGPFKSAGVWISDRMMDVLSEITDDFEFEETASKPRN